MTFPGTAIFNKDLRTSDAFPLDDLGQKHQLMTYGTFLEHIQQHIGRCKADFTQLVVPASSTLGCKAGPYNVLSTPMTATCSGTAMPCAFNSCIQPMASISVAQRMPSTSGICLSSSAVSQRPRSTELAGPVVPSHLCIDGAPCRVQPTAEHSGAEAPVLFLVGRGGHIHQISQLLAAFWISRATHSSVPRSSSIRTL